MIRTTRIDSWEDIEAIAPPGWLRDYVATAKSLRFPLSFHLLCGLYTLTSIVGRRAVLQMSGYRLYPPTWIILLGTSGVGKGVSMNLSYRVIREATAGRPDYLFHRPDTFTRRGLVAECQRVARDFNVNALEGAIMLDEGSSIFHERTGTETIMQFFIKAGELADVSDFTGYLGAQMLNNFTVGFAITSTIELLRESVNPSVFSGGFMHRWLISHEMLRPKTFDQERDVPQEEVDALARRAAQIRDKLPVQAELDSDAQRQLKRIAMQAEEVNYASTALAGFWNRLSGMSAKVALGLAISRASFVVTGDDVVRAERLVRGHLYPPIAELVSELALPKAKREIVARADDLFFAGSNGLPLNEFLRRLPGSSEPKLHEQLAFLRMLGLVHIGIGPGGHQWVWRLPEWATSGVLSPSSPLPSDP